MRCATTLPLLLTLAACAGGPGEGASESDGGPTADAAAGPPPLAGGRWELQNVSDSPGTLALHAQQLFVGDERVVAWSEGGEGGAAAREVVAAVSRGGGWSATPLTAGGQQNTAPSLVSRGDRLYVAWSGRPDALNDLDVHLSIRAGDTWLQAIDLTSAGEGDAPRRDRSPRIALGEDGELVVLYLSSAQGEGGADAGPADVRLLRVTGGEIGAPITVIDGSEDGCSEAALAIDPEHDVHVVARCGAGLLYAHDEERRDRFAVERLALTDAEPEGSPALHAGRGGVHLVFRGDVPCGDERCGEIYYARGTRSGLFTSAVAVSRDPGAHDVLPVVTSDAVGRVLVAFGKRGADRDAIHFSFSLDGVEFSAPELLDPGAPETRDEPTSLVVDPGTGLPSMTILRTFRGSDPGDVDVFVADRTAP